MALDLTYLARALAAQFASLELAHDAAQLTRLGPGRLTLDLLQRSAMHGRLHIAFPRMGSMLRHRLDAGLDLAEQSRSLLRRALIEAECRYRTIPPSDSIGMRGITWCGDTGPLVQADLLVTARLGTGDQHWQAQHTGVTTWPERLAQRP